MPGWLKACAVALVVIVLGLTWGVFSIHNHRREQVLENWREMQKVIIREAARNSEAWFRLRVQSQGADPESVKEEIFTNFVSSIAIPGMGEVWMACLDDVHIHRDVPYQNGAVGITLEEFFRERETTGGSHTDQVLNGMRKGISGNDWYIVDPQTGKEMVSWTPVWLGGEVGAIGLTAPESEVLAAAGVEEEFKRNFFLVTILSTLLFVVFFLLWREEDRVRSHAANLEVTIQEKTRELEYTNARYKTLVEQITAVTYVDANDLECTPIYMSPQMEKLFGYSQQDWRTNPTLWPDIIHPGDRDRVVAEHIRTFESGDPFCMDYRVYTKSGKLIWIHDESVLALDQKGEKTWQGVMYDISDRKAMEEELRYLGHHDSLTGLYSRAFMETELQRLQKSREFPVSIIMSDLDKLKTVNDKYGHAVGDEMLRRAASVIRSAFRAEDIIARMGGDEFAVVLPSTDAKAALKAIERIQKAAARETRAGIGPKLRISLGSATAEQNESLEQVVRKADRDMYHHKQITYAKSDDA